MLLSEKYCGGFVDKTFVSGGIREGVLVEAALEGDYFELPIEAGAFTDVPVFETHKRGKNWMARILPDPKSPGGLKREFAERARGDRKDKHYYYIVPKHWKVGDYIEFGADYYTSSGHHSPTRWYGVLVKKLPDKWILKRISRSEIGKITLSPEEVESEEELPLSVADMEALRKLLAKYGIKAVKDALNMLLGEEVVI